MAIDGNQLNELLGRIDAGLMRPGTVCLIGSGACILMGQTARQTDDLDVRARASSIDLAELRKAALEAGLAFDPKELFPALPYLQIVHPGIVQVPGWNPAERTWFGEPEREVWHGRNLIVCVPPAQALVASKMVRGDDRDFEDAIWLMAAQDLDAERVADAVKALPMPARAKARGNLDLLDFLRKG